MKFVLVVFACLGLASMAGAQALNRDLFSGDLPMKSPPTLAQMAPDLTENGQVQEAKAFNDPVSFEGRLTLTPLQPDGYKVVQNDHAYGLSNAAALAPPVFSFDIVQDGEHLYVTAPGPVNEGAESWDVLVGEGHIWSDGGEGGRISFPITLKEPAANCLHNGVLTFAFDRSGLKPRALYTIASETCAYFKFNLWGAMKVAFTPQIALNKTAIIARQRAIAAHRIKIRPIRDLGLDTSDLAKPFGDGDISDPPTSYGFQVGDTVFASGCPTRFGDNPLCSDTDLPSFSTAKSIFAAVALMRLETLNPGVADAMISDYVPECSDWKGIRFIDALDMATGRYDSAAYAVDEGSDAMAAFFAPADHAGKLGFACGHYKPKAAPKTRFVYHTADTYVLGTAMQAFYKTKGGGDLYDEVLRPIWSSISLSRRLDYTQRTLDAVRQPYTGYGLVYDRDDILRLASWLRHDGGGLNQALRDEALQTVPDKRGLMAYPPDYRYQHGFWARNIAPVMGCDHEVWVPFLSGFGGITVALLPHDITFYYFGDDQAFDWTQAIRTANQIKGLCT